MPRPQRCRRICQQPPIDSFLPTNCQDNIPIKLTLDEYEVIRLVDLENRTHDQCAQQMDISRSTVQEIYQIARRKIAACLVYGKPLLISGGNYRICHGMEYHRCGCGCDNITLLNNISYQKAKGELTMKIAVTYENGQIFQHFGHTAQFKVYEIQDNQIISSHVVDTAGSGHGALAGFLMQHGINILICGGIGGGAQNALAQAGIKLYGGVTGEADAAVQALLENNLQFNPNVHCSHHDHQHGQEGHTCGDHGCGSNHSCH